MVPLATIIVKFELLATSCDATTCHDENDVGVIGDAL